MTGSIIFGEQVVEATVTQELGANGPDRSGLEDVRILSIAGTGQNGSTLVSRLLGEVPGFVAIGEVGRLWDKGLIEQDACSCGSPVRECPFWSKVGDVAFGGWDEVDAEHVTRLRDTLVLKESRLQHPFALPFLLAPSVWPRVGEALREYHATMSRLYRAIHEVSGARVIVDAMKIPSHVYMLSGIGPGFDIRYVHLVRDSRGVANSNAKIVPRQGSDAGRPLRARRSARKSAIKWTWFNLSSGALVAARHVDMIRVRYEDVTRAPEEQLRRMIAQAGFEVDDEDLRFLDGATVSLSQGHLVAGNRMRLAAGDITIREDAAWRTDLAPRARKIVTATTWPLLRHYGYV